jgi:hypothetical protein
VSFLGSQASAISPFLKRSYWTVQVSSLMRSRRAFCFARYSASRPASRVPIVSVPLNIMCSKKWLMPVMPGRSFTEPTFASQPAATVFGWSWRGTSRNFIPFGRFRISGSTCWARASGAAKRAARTASGANRMEGLRGEVRGGRFRDRTR